MQLLVDDKIINTILNTIGIKFAETERVLINNYCFEFTQNGNFYLAENTHGTPFELVIVEIDDENTWTLDEFQSCFAFAKKHLEIDSGNITLKNCAPGEDCSTFTYTERTAGCIGKDSVSLTVPRAAKNKEEISQLTMCDVYLLCPGKLKSEDIAMSHESTTFCSDELFDTFKANIDYCVESEYNSNFSKKLRRKNFGTVKIIIEQDYQNDEHTQDAMVGIMWHETGYCVIEFFVYNCNCGGNKLLNYYCGEMLKYEYSGKIYSLEELCAHFGVERFGQKRSMVFAYGEVTDREIINALANEEEPMGEIGGDFEWKVKNQNVAQYDTARVYVSLVTMIEVCKSITSFVETRISYHAIEIFFVELLLLQDAAIDKVHEDLRTEHTNDTEKKISLLAERYEQISFDMAQAVEFANYEQFNYPTVRVSAKNVAKCFGIEYVFEKYEANKELLSSMIQANKRRIEEHQEKVKNYFLFLLSAIATVGTIGQMIHSIIQDAVGGVQSYSAALALVFFAYCIYRLLILIGKIKKKKGAD